MRISPPAVYLAWPQPTVAAQESPGDGSERAPVRLNVCPEPRLLDCSLEMRQRHAISPRGSQTINVSAGLPCAPDARARCGRDVNASVNPCYYSCVFDCSLESSCAALEALSGAPPCAARGNKLADLPMREFPDLVSSCGARICIWFAGPALGRFCVRLRIRL